MVEFGDEKGLSLLEVMVAMFMVALISSSLMGGFIISNKMIKLAEQETRASSYAYAILEDLRARPAKDWPAIVTGFDDDGGPSGKNSTVNFGADMQARIKLSEKSDFPSLYDVQVTVTWEEGGESRSLEMVTRLNAGLRGELP